MSWSVLRISFLTFIHLGTKSKTVLLVFSSFAIDTFAAVLARMFVARVDLHLTLFSFRALFAFASELVRNTTLSLLEFEKILNRPPWPISVTLYHCFSACLRHTLPLIYLRKDDWTIQDEKIKGRRRITCSLQSSLGYTSNHSCTDVFCTCFA